MKYIDGLLPPTATVNVVDDIGMIDPDLILINKISKSIKEPESLNHFKYLYRTANRELQDMMPQLREPEDDFSDLESEDDDFHSPLAGASDGAPASGAIGGLMYPSEDWCDQGSSVSGDEFEGGGLEFIGKIDEKRLSKIRAMIAADINSRKHL